MSRAVPANENGRRHEILRDRAAMLAAARRFFAERDVVEVDCPSITTFPPIDAHIDVMRVHDGVGQPRYLHTSPEYAMKRLLSGGLSDIYQLGHVYRAGEAGDRHNPEFTMAEWYRCGFSLDEMAAETAAFAMLFLGEQPYRTLSYRAAFQEYAGIDYACASADELRSYLATREATPSPVLESGGIDELLNIIMGTVVEPHLGCGEITAIVDYPATQCALAETAVVDGVTVARRFELYSRGHELANGYYELRDAAEQRRRFAVSNTQRTLFGKEPLPVDEYFLEALAHGGLPVCSGVAVGFDRLMMLRHGTACIRDVLPFSWDDA